MFLGRFFLGRKIFFFDENENLNTITDFIFDINDNIELKLNMPNEIFFDLGSTPNCFGPYFLQALKKKPICVVTKNKKYNNIYSTKIYTVNNLLQFFRLSVIEKYKKKPNYLCAVTGTNGKTSVAHYFLQLNKLLNISCASVGTIGIYQNRKKIKMAF